MSDRRIRPAVIVGIDGSQAAVHAAEWAADEALGRAISLLMLAIIKATHPSAEDYHRDVAHAETSLHAARLAVEAMGRPVKVETDILRGPAGAILVSESDDAEMICVGSIGIGRYSRALLGSTATEVAEKAHCPVAVIRYRPDRPSPDINWIVVKVSDAPGRDTVIDQAMREAQLRNLPVLAIGTAQAEAAEAPSHELDNRLWPWRRWYPDVHIYPVAAGGNVAHFLKSNDDLVPLAVIGGADAGQLAQIVGPHDHPVFRHAQSSALIVRE
ncbi:universal stress protein [Candidatus Mycobacterium methanotrophicum]|uniref:Universal stress protein n=1 Tax=Candidatus Mycobacterium methanotrophicum TaxID=2943498 RepID=A0ABY4QKI6_9MYCO|nr:universal stress protein [Candidatus Mycobacterium methanotrophicum]UQX10356.1 universal stress protein [Candidatus Mycobacterium methanotrophicum]